MSLCTLQASTVLVSSGHVMNGMCSICSYRWDTVGNGSSALMEYHGELGGSCRTHGVVRSLHTHGVPRGIRCTERAAPAGLWVNEVDG